jgi:hypothetical protein
VLEAEYDVGGADQIMLQATYVRRWRQGRDPRRCRPPGRNLIGTCNADRGDHLPRSLFGFQPSA